MTGFGEDAFGEDAFGDESSASGFLPAYPPFDIYNVRGADMAPLLTYVEVDVTGESPQYQTEAVSSDLLLRSGGTYSTGNVFVSLDVLVPQTFTFELYVSFNKLPTNFSDLSNRHIFLGTFNAQGNAVGLFISSAGILYSGAVHHTGGNLVIDGPTQPLPNSASLVEQNTPICIRIATSHETGTTYIYWTRIDELEENGHQLRYVLPSIISASGIQLPPDSTLLSVRGSLTEPSYMSLSDMGLGTGLLIPNLRPVAEPGVDQAVRSCAIVQMDGTNSFDPEGSSLLYAWRLVDAPATSSFAFDSLDALTYPEPFPNGFTDHIYSEDLEIAHAEDPFQTGDVIIIAGENYQISSFGVDGSGFFVDIGDQLVPDSFSTGQSFKVLRQRGISNATSVKPTFLPDVPGLFKFDLIVFDGDLYSEPAYTVINVTASPLPRGLIPDLKFLWDYLSDFWRLVEDRERIEVFWSALAQVAASELLALWQTDYSKSLRDVQRTFQRRWLHYDLLMKEPADLVEFSSVRAVYGGIESDPIPAAGMAIAGTTLELFIPAQTEALPIYFSGADLQTADTIAARINATAQLAEPSISAKVITDRDGLNARVRIDAPFAISVSGESTATLFGLRENTLPAGSSGVVTGVRSYRVERSLAELDIKEGDLLVVGTGAYRISRVIDDVNDSFLQQRVALLDDIPPDAGANWIISGKTTSQSIDFYSALFSAGDIAELEVVNLETGVLSYASVAVTGVCAAAPRSLGIDTTQLGQYINDSDTFKVYFLSGTRRQYTPVDDLVADVPYLQELIKNTDDELVLRRNLDYFLETFRGIKCIRFVVNNDVAYDVWEGLVPPARLWAEITYLDNRPVIETNFGIPAEFTLDDLSELPANIDYLSAVRGLWYAYLSGPTLFNVRAGVQILLGLPFAEVESTIEEIRDDFSSVQGRLLLRDVKDTEIVRTYTYPHGLEIDVNPSTGLPYVVGDTVKQFAPVVTGAYVADWIKDPNWFRGLLNQGSFYEIEKFAKFLIQVDSAAFNLSALLFVRQFVLRIKPTYLFPLFVVRADLGDAEVSVSDVVTLRGVLKMFVGSVFGLDGQAQMWDQPRPGGGGFWNQFDASDPNGADPVSPTAQHPVDWAFDEYYLSPNAVATAKLTTVHAGGAPVAGSIFYAAMPIFTDLAAALTSGGLRRITTAGTPIGEPVASAISGTLTKITFFYRGVGDDTTLSLIIRNNGVVVHTEPFVIPALDADPDAPQYKFNIDVSLAVLAGDVLSASVSHTTGFNTYVESVGVFLGIGQDWDAGVALPADTYFTYLVL